MDSAPAIDKRQVRESFDRAATGYDAAAVLQQEVCRRMLSRLDYIKVKPAAILDAGCGTGNVVPAFKREFPQASFYALDIAMGMLRQTSARIPWWKRALGRGVLTLCG